MAEYDVTDEDMELGMLRAEVNRLCAKLGRIRGKSHYWVLVQLMHTKTWQAQGNPDPKYINAEQAKTFIGLLEKWIEQAQARPAKSSHIVSKAPPAPWMTRRIAAQEGGQQDGG